MRLPQIRLVLLLVSAVLVTTVVANLAACQQAATPLLTNGATGLRVTGLQWLLNAERADVGVTGTYAGQTAAAVRGFQGASGLEPTGEVDRATFTRLTPDAKLGDRGLRVRAVQTLLNLQGQPTGVYDDFDAATAEKVRAFHAAKDLDDTGAVDRATWDALFEGESTGPTVSEADQFFETIAPHAREAKHAFGVPAAVSMAQSAQETGWGRSAPGNNYFGVKCHGRPASVVKYDCIDHRTNEWENGEKIEITDSFRTYASMRDSVMDYANFLKSNSRYAPAFRFSNDPDAFARELQVAGYATDPTYADSLIDIMKQRDLYAYDR
ncbi:glucosaminidase domain-containing protein [Ammonicoccus fulvus]|uniref:Glucosaminidase domain-containing protein n=1 Tax=Ammonicoccus fulvus TaxID=3138240 RepID=A0ABZ3FIN5_9ACTN